MIDGWKVEGLSFQDYLEGHTDEIVGEGNAIEYDFQSTLDSWRSYGIVEDKLEETDERLREEYGSGIDFAMIYGSSTQGLSILSDSFLARNHQPGEEWFDESDIDVIIGLEDVDEDIDSKTYRQDAASMMYQNCREDNSEMPEYPDPKVHPLVHKSSFLVDTFRKARENWLARGGQDKEQIRLKGQPKNDAVYEMNQQWHNFIRGFVKGVAFPEEYYNSEFHEEIDKGKDILLEDGSLRNDVEFDVSSEAAYFGDNRLNRVDRLNRNYLYGLWDLAKRRHGIEVPPKAGRDELVVCSAEDRAQNTLNQQTDRPFRQVVYSVIDKELSDRELGEIFDYDLQNASNWIDEMDNEERERKRQRVKGVLKDNIEAIEDLMAPEFLEDKGFSRHNNITDDLTVQGLEGDYKGLVNALYRNNGYYENFELRMAAELTTRKIKQKYAVIEDEGFDMDKQMHEIPLGDLIELEEEAKLGKQSRIQDF